MRKALKIKSLKNVPKRAVYVFLAVLILSSSYLLWWRPDRVHAQTDTFTSNGNWIVPANVSSATFEAWGGGGAGAGASTNSTAGGGGAGGQYASSTVSVNPGDSYPVLVASAVGGGTGNGTTGNSSIVFAPGGSSTVVQAQGGAGGTANNGAGGTGSTTGAIGNNSVQPGGNGAAGSGSSGGGGGGAGSSGPGGNASGQTAGTGTASNGGNGGTGNPSGTSAAGQAGSNYGGGGSGGVKRTGSSVAGGAGGQGYVTITYTPVSYTQSNYRWFANADSATPGSALTASQNQSATLTSTGQAFRLRQLITPGASVSAGASSFDEQYAYLSSYGSCSAVPSANWGSIGSNVLTPSAPTLPGQGSDVVNGGIQAWSNTGSITANDASYATAVVPPLGGGNTDALVGDHLGFSIPSDATINGIGAAVVGHSSSGNVYDGFVKLEKGGTIGGNSDAQPSTNLWATSDMTHSYGSPSDLWGQTWTPADINTVNFGLSFQATTDAAGGQVMSVNYITVTVYYTPAATSQGPSFAGTGGDDSSIGTGVWSNTGNITADDGSSSTVTVFTSTPSQYLTATNFGFTIPAGATIEGIAIQVKKGGASATDNAVRLIKAGSVQSFDESSGTAWSSSPTYASYGGAADLWGGTWTPGDINASNFGFAISGQATSTVGLSVDAITATVYYSAPGTGAISYKDNPTPANGAAISATGSDPTDPGQTVSPQTYQEANGFTTTGVTGGTIDAEWDLSMYDNGAAAGSVFCFRTASSGGTALSTYSQYPQITTYNPPSNSAPNIPSLTVPSSGATGVSTTPTFSLSATDPDGDAVKYRLYLYQSDCSTGVGSSPFAQATSGTGWDNGTTAYSSGATANYTYQGTLANSTQYCWKADAIDPGGTNGYGSASSTRLFTTAAASGGATIQGGVDIRGGSTIQ